MTASFAVHMIMFEVLVVVCAGHREGRTVLQYGFRPTFVARPPAAG